MQCQPLGLQVIVTGDQYCPSATVELEDPGIFGRGSDRLHRS